MRGEGNTRICAVGLLLFGLSVSGLGSDGNPYQPVVDRNVFGLKPPTPPPPPDANKPPPPPIKLTGILTLGGKRAIMSMQMPAKPPAPAQQKSFMLAEGQRDDEVEVLEIDEKNGVVKVTNFGTPMTLTFDKDPPKAPGAPPVPQPPVPPNPAVYPNPAAYPGAGTNVPIRTVPSRVIRMPQPGATQ